MSVAVFTFGRFNPPTNGHGVLADKIKSVARRSGGKPFIFTGHSKDAKKNPLDYKSKIKYMSKAFRGVDVVNDASIRTIFDALKYLDKKNYEEVKLIVGSDRVPEFRKLLKKYLKDYGFTKFEVVSAGERDPDAEGVKGMSASKMRAAVARNDYDSFLLGCPKGLSKKDCLQMFNDVKKGMGVSESINEELWFNHEEFEQFCERTMSLAARKKMARVARRTAKKRARTRKRKEKFRKTDDKLKTLAKKQAKMKLRQKMLGDKHWGDLSIGARQKIDNMLQKKAKKIEKMSKKLYPAVKKQERERIQNLRNPGPSDQKEGKELLREPEIYDRLVSQLKAKGKDNDAAHAIATSQLQKHGILKKGTRELTDKGRERNSMSASERAKDRAAKKDGKSPKDYKYNNNTNIATQKEELMKEHSEEKPLLKWMEVFRSELKKSGSSYKKVEPTDALKLYYKGVDPKKAAAQLKESVELGEAWTADSVIKNAEIGSKKGYGITIKKTGGITKTPHKHMLMTMRRDKSVRVTFDHGKDEFEGTPQSVALYINKKLGIKESVELDEGLPSYSYPTFKEIQSKGKKLGDWMGKSYFEYEGSVWMLKNGRASNQGPVAQAKKKFNKSLLKNLKFESVELDEVPRREQSGWSLSMHMSPASESRKAVEDWLKSGKNKWKKYYDGIGGTAKDEFDFSFSNLPNKKEAEKLQVAIERTIWKGKRFLDYIDDIYIELDESIELSEFVPKSMDAKAALSVYDKLKKGSKVAVEYNSMIGGSGSSTGKPFELVVSSPHRVVGKSKVGRIILKNPKNMGGAKYTLYNRNGKISLAHGDMGTILKDLKIIKESVEVDEACWDTHVQKGMKKKGGKMVPNCVPKGVTDAVETPTTKHATDNSSWRKYKGSNSKQKSFEEDTFKKKAVRDVEAKFKPQTDALKRKIEIAKKKRDSIKVTSIDTSARDAARKRKEEADKKLAAIRAKLAAARANSIRGRSQNTSKPSDVEENHASLKDRRAYLKKTVADRTARVLARREMIKKGKAKVGDGKDVDHKDGNPRNNSNGNLRMMDVNSNRSRNNNEEHGAGDEGTDKLLKKYRKDTPHAQDNKG